MYTNTDTIHRTTAAGWCQPWTTMCVISLKQAKPDSLKNYNQGPVVQSMVRLTSLLRGQLVKCFTTLLPNTLIL